MKTGRTLVVYYSLSGNTQLVARDLAARLGADLERIEEQGTRTGFLGYLSATLSAIRQRPVRIKDPRRDPNDYALTVIGTPVWAGRMTPAVRAYLGLKHARLNEVAFFTTSGSTGPEKVVAAMESVAGQRAVAFSGFNRRELDTPAVYERKIAAFVMTMQGEKPSVEASAATI